MIQSPNQGVPLFPPSASTTSGDVDGLLFLLLGVSIFFATLICSLIIVFVVRYRRRPEWSKAVAIEGSLALELLWTIIPLIIAMGIFVWSAKVYFRITRVPLTRRERVGAALTAGEIARARPRADGRRDRAPRPERGPDACARRGRTPPTAG